MARTQKGGKRIYLTDWVMHCREETTCRFCEAQLPDWKPILTPSAEEVAKASPTMSVTFNGQVTCLVVLLSHLHC